MMQSPKQELSFARGAGLAAAGIFAIMAPVVCGVAWSPRAQAQNAPEQPLAFEVASVKPASSAELRGMADKSLAGGRYVANNMPVHWLIANAFGVAPQTSARLTGEPAWTHTERYDIEATPAKGAIPPGLLSPERNKRQRAMLRTLLAERFHLKVHTEPKDMPLYLLVFSKSGPKLRKSKLQENDCAEETTPPPPCHILNGGQGRGLHGKAVSLAEVLTYIENWSDRPIIDKTGLQGLFDIDTEGWVSMRAPPPTTDGAELTAEQRAQADPTRHTLFTVLDQLGLKLEPAKGPVNVIVVDSVQKATAN